MRACVRAWVRLSTHSGMNISATSRLVTMRFFQKNPWGGRKAALGFGPDRIRTLVSMATDKSHRVIIGKTVLPLFSAVLSDPFHISR